MQFLWDSEISQFTLEKILFCLCCDLGITGQHPSEELGCRQSVQSAGVQSFLWLERLKLWVLWQVPSHPLEELKVFCGGR